MSKCCGNGKKANAKQCDPCAPPSVECGSVKQSTGASDCPLAYFENMIDNCYDYAVEAKANGKPIVGIMCEFAPRELIMAAGGVPVCLCGGSAKTIPAAEEHLPSNLCPLIKSTYGYHIEKKNPFLEMADLIVAETTCDGKKKMFELMAESRPVYVMELPQKQDDPDAFQHWVCELEKLKLRLEEQFGVQITDCKLKSAIEVMNRERSLRRNLAEMMAGDDPPLTGRELLQFKSSISGIPADFEQYEKALSMFSGKSRVKDSKSRVRILMTGVPTVHGAERVVEIVENHGGKIVCMENCTGIKPIIDDIDPNAPDLIQAVAEKYFNIHCAVMTKNKRRMEVIRELATKYRAECIVDLIWQGCTTYDIESFYVKKLAEEELGIPYLRIETDYSPSDSARIAVRVEALFETVKNNAHHLTTCG